MRLLFHHSCVSQNVLQARSWVGIAIQNVEQLVLEKLFMGTIAGSAA
jgi:hypothetical protein